MFNQLLRTGITGKRSAFGLFVIIFLLTHSFSCLAQTVTGTNTVPKTNSVDTSGLTPPPPPPLVLTNPPPGPVPRFPSFSPQPTTAEIQNARVFEEPLIPIGGIPSAEENAALANALVAFASRTNADDFTVLESYLSNAPNVHWYPSVLFSLGWEYYNTGYYSKALDAWEEAWFWLQDEDKGAAKRLADRCVGELAIMHARIGDYDRLQGIFYEMGDRRTVGSASELIAGSRQALWLMQNRPSISFRCGPLALRNVCKLLNPDVDVDEIVESSASTTNGFSMQELQQLSQALKINFQVAKHQPGTPLLLPCVVNWNVGHYAAVLKQDGYRYFVADPTFGISRWISKTALEYETSGYFLVPPGSLPSGWQPVGSAEAATVWGKGVTGNSDPNDTTMSDEMSDPDCNSHGMTIYNFHLMLVSLHLEDTPLSFTPPRGPTISLTVVYNQREANQPANFNYSNFGQKWTCNWISYLVDNGTNPPGDVQYYVPGGGTETFSYQTNGTYVINWRNQATLTQLSSTGYAIAFPDGSKRIFGQPNGTVGNSRKVFLTQITDPTGYTNLLNYDSNLRLVSVTDPQAGLTNLTFYYAVSGGSTPVDIYKIQQVTDRYGRIAVFTNNASSELQSITDPLGITSSFSYDSSGFINTLQTPYGTTTFAEGDDGNGRWLEATDPQGGKSRAEFNQSESIGIPNSDPGTVVPRGIYTRNYILYGRNTFYWDKKAMAEAPGDYSKARLYHWLHNANLASAEGALESVKQPLENRVWFNYPGQGTTSAGATIYGSQNLPSAAGRVGDDGTTQLYQFYRNSLGKITNAIDPAGLNFTYVYATNQIDLLQVRQTANAGNELVASFTYNSQHLPLTAVDASGQTNRFGYNAYGQLTSITNALSQVTTFTNDASGRLLSITGPTNNDTFTFTYDAFDRIKTMTDPDGYTVTLAYDALDHPTNISYPDNTSESITYQYLDPQTYVDRSGKVTQCVYDSLRHLTQITEATNWITYFDWCTCGNLAGITDPLGRTTKWFYDIQGRPTAKQYTDGSSVKYGYEKTTSRLHTFTNERNQTRTFYYYANGLFEGVAYANSAITPTVAFNYDLYGRVVAMYDGYGNAYGTNTTFSYYPITTPPTLGAGRLKMIGDPNGNTMTYTYDALGRVQGSVMTNNLFGSTIIGADVYTNMYVYDVLGRVAQHVTKLGGGYTYTYAGTSPRIASIVYPAASMVTTFGYYNTNGDFHLRGLTNMVGSTLLSKFSYAYDVAGRITNMAQQVSATVMTNRYTYDAVGELVNVATNANTNAFGYAYDLAGNRTMEKNHGNTWKARFNPLNAIQSKDQGLSSTNISYQWDEENRVVSVTEGKINTTMIYNGLGRLAYLAERNNGVLAMYHTYVWDGNKIAEEAFVTTNNNSEYCHWHYDYGHFDSYVPGFVFTTRDGLGSVREMYSPHISALLMQYDYDPYGRQSTLLSSYATPPSFGYTDFLGMPGHNLDMAEHRVYDPDMGRWLSRDPIGEAGGLNLYRYVNNDPINDVDPSGLCPLIPPTGDDSGRRPPRGPIVASAAGGDAPLNPHTPRGFQNLTDFLTFSRILHAGLGDAGLNGVEALFQGSSVTGKSYRTGQLFDSGRRSDFDIALAGDTIFENAKALGIPLRSGGTRTGPLTDVQLSRLGLLDLAQTLSEEAGRPVNFMVFQNVESAISRGPSILTPH